MTGHGSWRVQESSHTLLTTPLPQQVCKSVPENRSFETLTYPSHPKPPFFSPPPLTSVSEIRDECFWVNTVPNIRPQALHRHRHTVVHERAEGSNLGLLKGRVRRDRYETGLTFYWLQIKRRFRSQPGSTLPIRPCSLHAHLPPGLSPSPLSRAPLLHLRNERISLRAVVRINCN